MAYLKLIFRYYKKIKILGDFIVKMGHEGSLNLQFKTGEWWWDEIGKLKKYILNKRTKNPDIVHDNWPLTVKINNNNLGAQ